MARLPGQLRPSGLTLLVGACGAALAWAINMPMGFLIGPALAVALASLGGLTTDIAPGLRNTIFIIVGLTVGSMVTPTSIEAVLRWPIAFSMLAILTLATPFVGRWCLTRLLSMDRDEAFLSAAPGHLSLVVSLSDSLGLNVTRPAILASLRVLALSMLVPLAARLSGIEIGPGLPMDRATATWGMIALQLGAALLLAPILIRLRLPAPVLLAAMITATGFQLSGTVSGNLPPWISQIMLVMMGCLIGTRFSGVTWRDLQRNIVAGAMVILLTTSLAALIAFPAAKLSGLPVIDLMVGFAPGGLETMLIVGVAMGADASFVASAHVGRLLLLAVVLTTYATAMVRRNAHLK